VVGDQLGPTEGWSVHPKRILARHTGAKGVLTRWAPGHDDAGIWFVRHPDGEEAAYHIEELKPVTPPVLPSTQGLWLGEPEAPAP
jgi:hypothetical protein